MLTESDDLDIGLADFGRISAFKLFYAQLMDSNKDYISLIVSSQQQSPDNL